MAHGFDQDWLDARQRHRIGQQLRQEGQHPGSTPLSAMIAPKVGKRAKYGNEPVLVDLGPSGEIVGGKLRLVHTFDSMREAAYFAELKLRRQAGEIENLELQKAYALIAHAQCGPAMIIGYYEADFVFDELRPRRQTCVIDVKGVKTQVYALKKKLAEACWNITIEEV